MPRYDITPAITSRLGVWPGDTPPSREILLEIDTGATVTLSTLRATVHLGAHADGPNHYAAGAPAIDERSLDYYLGPCVVVHVDVARGRRVTPGDFDRGLSATPLTPPSPHQAGEGGRASPQPVAAGLPMALPPRVLIGTGTFPDPNQWNNDFAALSPELVDHLHVRGVRTIGIDTPSVDLMDDKQLLAHKRFLAHDMAILEGVVLRDVPAGTYELIALPLRLVGFDASPVRAILRTR